MKRLKRHPFPISEYLPSGVELLSRTLCFGWLPGAGEGCHRGGAEQWDCVGSSGLGSEADCLSLNPNRAIYLLYNMEMTYPLNASVSYT